MVWGLFPVDSLPGDQRYYIFSKGTYKVGRKGCDVIINTDKGVSRIHAEIVVDSMTSLDPLERRSSTFSSNVRIKDCSKYGTFINKKAGAKTKVGENPNKEAPLKDGDLLSFGTGNATFSFCFVPLVFFLYNTKASRKDRSLQEEISLIGARATHGWSAECTHVLVEESMPVKEDLFDAIVAQKPVVPKSWLKVFADKKICAEIPNFDNYIPILKLEGLPVKIADPKIRENCVADYTFLLGDLELYKFGDKLRSLLGVGGAKVLSVDEYCSSTSMSQDGANSRVLLVNSPGSVNHSSSFQQLRSVSRVNEISLVVAVLSGHLDQSIVESPPITVSSSCSTDETIVEDSDLEMEAVTSLGASLIIKSEENIKDDEAEDLKDEGEEHLPGDDEAQKIEVARLIVDDSISNSSSSMVRKREQVTKLETSTDHGTDIIYSQNLIVRDTNTTASVPGRSTGIGIINFKCFRKKETESGNSFSNLVPYAKYPYRETEYGNQEVAEYVKQEKKRKQLESVAEDLFNNDKAKRQKAGASSLHGLMARG